MAYNKKEFQKTYITGSTTNVIFTGKGTLHAINVNTTTATALQLFDATSGTNTGTIALYAASLPVGSYEFDCVIANGLYMTSGAAGDYTVLWTK